MEDVLGTTVMTTLGVLTTWLHFRTLADPEQSRGTRALWKYYNISWISPFNPRTRLTTGMVGFGLVTLFAAAQLVAAVVHLAN